MIRHVKAVYRHGVLRPLDPLNLKEEEVVSLSIEHLGEDGQETEEDYASLIAEVGDDSVSWDQVRAILNKLPGPLADDFEREREERF